MTEENKFCPSCGASIDGVQFCQQCGFQVNQKSLEKPIEGNVTATNNSPTTTTTASPNYNPSTWNTLEPFISLAGKLSWILIVLNIIVSIIVAAVNLAEYGYVGAFVWAIIGGAISLALAGIFIKPFAIMCGKKDWEGLINDVWKFGKYRVPKMLVLGIILEIFTDGWGGLLVLIPAVLILILGPVKHQWEA
ncbi:hypothetical protein NEF87_002222 [Candidatus Lokiarchaeum ossiferum]|uniref:Zinc-ribbon domain-containing protein n=1 Tax=Candidatus Lokiarchaeum ossiferum TaxID=2951803 RepID=A0ABY6HUB0_9ARCH|nr:hypothetical protein NEF87_002222 [Candidatus Lokiarchaeum sp. B-35]